MKSIFIIVAIILCLLFYPQFNEDTGSSCAALERQAVRLLTENNEGSVFAVLLFKGLSGGAFAQEIVKSKYPNLPPILGCSFFYYRLILEPGMAQKLKSYS
tara:strand:- start:41 stop:343 length:303 start_codon:yes stop_codon:yes gene_type:complete